MFEKYEIRPQKRSLTYFLYQELAYDYIANRLDSSRRNAVEDFIEKNQSAKDDLKLLTSAIQYCEKLQAITLAPESVTMVQQSIFDWKKMIQLFSLRRLPISFRWSVEALLIAVFVAFIGIFVPWDRWQNRDTPKGDAVVVVANTKLKNSTNPQLAATMSQVGRSEEETPLPDDKSLKKLDPSEISRPPHQVQSPPTPVAPPTVAAVSPAPKESTPSDEAETVSEQKSASPKPAADRGFVYRAFLAVGDIDGASAQVLEKIVELGGQKAGEVDLGWKKGSSSYYHFTLPESNYDQLMAFLNTFSPVRIYKDAHKRIMPEGQIRLILLVSPQKSETSSN